MKATVKVHMGDIFEGKADLTVLPCGAKPTWSSSVQRWIDKYGIPTPKELMSEMRLSDVTDPVPFPDSQDVTKYIAYGASVLNKSTTPNVIRKLGENIGSITVSHGDIKFVESVLFGTGYGGLSDSLAARALSRGFKTTAVPDATLWIFVHGGERSAAVRKVVEGGFVTRFVDALIARPAVMGFGINLKKLFGLEK